MREDLQFPFRNGELCEAATQTDQGLLKNPHDGLVQTFESAEVNGNFPVEHPLLIGMASFTVMAAPQFYLCRLSYRWQPPCAVQN